MKLDEAGFQFIKTQEGCRLGAYQDQGGVWTIGYGCTQGVKAGDVITQAQADALFRVQLAKFEKGINQLVTIPLAQNEFDALVSFAYNAGLRALENSTLLRVLNSGDRKGAAKQFLVWCNVKGNYNSGLEARRMREVALFLASSDEVTGVSAY